MGKDRTNKQTIGKDKTGKFHPAKGKPSGINKDEGLGIQATPPEHLDQYNDITDKYTTDADEFSPNVPVRHPNRNNSKGEDQYKAKENKPDSDNTIKNSTTEETKPVVPEELPGVLSKELFNELASYTADPCVSVLIATHRSGVEVNERYDPISFKNTLQQVETNLSGKVDATTVQRMLEPGYKLLKDDSFWLKLSPGLAIFIADGFFKYIKMPVTPAEDIVIEKSFYVTPLVPIMISKEYFYLLVISKHTTKLFRADAFGMEQVPVEVPESVGDVKRLSEKDATTWRTGGRGGTGGANFHGVGGGNTDEKTNIAVYFEAVDDIYFKEIFNKENAPLLLAGVEYLIPIYKSVCDYHNVCDAALTGSHEHTDHSELYKLAKEKMESYFMQRLHKALDSYGNQSATELTSGVAADVVPATYYGRVSHLFVAKGEHVWGTFDEMANEIKFGGAEDEEAEDLIDNAVVKTLATGGDVFLIDKEKMPAFSQIAAIFRY